MFKYHIIHESVSVSNDTLTGALCHATIYVTNYTSVCAVSYATPLCVLWKNLWKTGGYMCLYHMYLTF